MLNRNEVVMGDTVNEKCNPISSHTLHDLSSILSLLYSNLTRCLGIECKWAPLRLEKCKLKLKWLGGLFFQKDECC